MEVDKDVERRLKNDKDGCNMRVVRTAPGAHGSLHTAAEKQSLPQMLRLRFVAASLPPTCDYSLSPHAAHQWLPSVQSFYNLRVHVSENP